MALSNSALRFAVTVNLDTNKLSVSDVTPYSDHSLGAVTINGIFRITGPSGIFYANAGYASSDFSSPDFSAIGTAEKTLADIELPEDSSGDVLLGNYQVEMMVLPDTAVDPYTISKTIDFSVTAPVCDLRMEAECSTSSLSLTDATDYTVHVDGEAVAPISSSRTWITKHQKQATSEILDTIDDSNVKTISPIWTKTYITNVTTVLSYVLRYWTDGDNTSGNLLYMNCTIEDNESLDVECDDCMCDYYYCFKTVKDAYEVARTGGSNAREADRLLKTLVTLSSSFALMQIAKRCGESYQQWCDQIKLTLRAENCSCDPTTTTESVEVVPWESLTSTSSTGGTIWFYFTGTPAGGNHGDFGVTNAGLVYRNINGVWTYVFSIVGPTGAAGADATGAAGADGADGADGQDGVVILSNPWAVGSTGNGVSLETLSTYVLPGTTVTTDGEQVEIQAVFELVANANAKTVSLYVGATQVGSFYMDSNTNDTAFFIFNCTLSRVSATTAKYVIKGEQAGNPGALQLLSVGDCNATWASDITITAKGQNGVASAGDISCVSLSVKNLKMAV